MSIDRICSFGFVCIIMVIDRNKQSYSFHVSLKGSERMPPQIKLAVHAIQLICCHYTMNNKEVFFDCGDRNCGFHEGE